MLKFSVYGPFKVPTKKKQIKGGKSFAKELDLDGLWERPGFSEFSEKKGCYVFVNAVSKGAKPIYAGKTTKTFKQECFALQKKALLNDFLIKKEKTGLQIIFVVMEGHAKSCSEAIDSCETFLIQKSLKANKDLLNVQKCNKSYVINGLDEGKGNSKSVKIFQKMP